MQCIRAITVEPQPYQEVSLPGPVLAIRGEPTAKVLTLFVRDEEWTQRYALYILVTDQPFPESLSHQISEYPPAARHLGSLGKNGNTCHVFLGQAVGEWWPDN